MLPLYKSQHLWEKTSISSLPSSPPEDRSCYSVKPDKALKKGRNGGDCQHQSLREKNSLAAGLLLKLWGFLLFLEAAAQACWGTKKWENKLMPEQRQQLLWHEKWVTHHYLFCYLVLSLKISQLGVWKFFSYKVWRKHHREQGFSCTSWP